MQQLYFLLNENQGMFLIIKLKKKWRRGKRGSAKSASTQKFSNL